MRKRHAVLGAFLVLGLVAAGCGDDDDSTDTTDSEGTTPEGEDTTPAGTSAPVEGAEITIALGSEPTSLDPHLVDDGGERAINDNIYETLLARTPDGALIPSLATELPTQVDDTTVRIMTDGPDGVLPARMYWLKIVSPGDAESDDLSDAPNGTGPYTFVGRETGVSIELAANPDYWDGAPSISSVFYEFVAEGGTRLAGLKSGEYDLITNLPPQDVDQAPQSANIQGQENPIIILDVDEGITADENVRLALNLAVDKDAIAEQVYGGYAQVVNAQLLAPSILGHNESLEAFPYDPEEAQRLIEEAGVAGETITLIGESSGRWLNDRELVEAIANYWTEAGLQVDLQTPEFSAYLDILFAEGNREDAIFVSSSNDLLDPSRQLNNYYASSGIGSSNSNEELETLVQEGQSTLDQDARDEIYQEAVAIAADGAYFTFLVSNEDLYGLSERLEFTPRVDSKLLVKEMAVTG